jgi:hypothetical protein
MANNEEVNIWGVLLTLGGAWLGYKVYENRDEIFKSMRRYQIEQRKKAESAQTSGANNHAEFNIPLALPERPKALLISGIETGNKK